MRLRLTYWARRERMEHWTRLLRLQILGDGPEGLVELFEPRKKPLVLLGPIAGVGDVRFLAGVYPALVSAPGLVPLELRFEA